MKKILLLFIGMYISYATMAQSPYGEVTLDQKQDYKRAETDVLKAVNYLFSSKYDKDDLERLYAIEFVMRWMAGTPDYTFRLEEKFLKPFNSEADLIGLYMAALSKYAIDHKAEAKDAATMNYNAAKMVIEYSNKPTNALKQTGELKKMATALKKGELEKYFGS